MSSWMDQLKAKKQECEQHAQWTPYWHSMEILACARAAQDAKPDQPFSFQELEKFRPDAEARVDKQRFDTIERLTESGEQWQPEKEVVVGDLPGETLPLELVLMLPYAETMRIQDTVKSVRKTLLLIDTNKLLSDENREQLRRALYGMYEMQILDEAPIPTDVEAMRHFETVDAFRRAEQRAFERECEPGEVHVPKSQRRDFAQTRGPRPQHNAHFSKQNNRGRQMPRRGGGRGR